MESVWRHFLTVIKDLREASGGNDFVFAMLVYWFIDRIAPLVIRAFTTKTGAITLFGQGKEVVVKQEEAKTAAEMAASKAADIADNLDRYHAKIDEEFAAIRREREEAFNKLRIELAKIEADRKDDCFDHKGRTVRVEERLDALQHELNFLKGGA